MAGKPIETVLDIINQRMIPNEEAKNIRGEVFTPIKIIQELLYGLRKDPLEKGILDIWGVDVNGNIVDDPSERVGGIPLEIWQNPDSKWLDPANGIGNFPFVVFQMLDFQLKYKLKDTVARRKHIVEKMLFMIEIDKGNVNTTFKIFEQLAPGYKPNICCADTLKLKDADLNENFGVSKFDVIMGNPPFQKPKGIESRKGSYGGNTLWDKFIILMLNKLTPNGYLVFITPPLWRKPDSGLWTPMTQTNKTRYLRVLNKKTSEKEFKVTQRIDLYILQNSEDTSDSIIVDEKTQANKINLSLWPFLPNYAYSDISKIITSKNDGIKIIYNSFYDSRKPYINTKNIGEFIHPIVHGITQKGLSLIYTKDNTKGHFGIPKVILNFNEQQYPINDFEGKYGMSQISYGIPIATKEEGDLIVRAINTDRFKEIIKATKWGTFQTDYHMFQYFKPDFYKDFINPAGGRKTRRNRRRGTMKKGDHP